MASSTQAHSQHSVAPPAEAQLPASDSHGGYTRGAAKHAAISSAQPQCECRRRCQGRAAQVPRTPTWQSSSKSRNQCDGRRRPGPAASGTASADQTGRERKSCSAVGMGRQRQARGRPSRPRTKGADVSGRQAIFEKCSSADHSNTGKSGIGRPYACTTSVPWYYVVASSRHLS